MIDMQKVEILGIPVFAGPLDHAIDCVIEQCIAPAEFREALKSCFLNLPDLMSMRS
jgi:hypothetical protein